MGWFFLGGGDDTEGLNGGSRGSQIGTGGILGGGGGEEKPQYLLLEGSPYLGRGGVNTF